MPERLMLEYSMESIGDFGTNPVLAVENTLKARDKVQQEYPDIEISLLPYARIKSVFTGGRYPQFSCERFLEVAKVLNTAKIACAVVLNGGLLFPKNIDINWGDPRMADIKQALDALAERDVGNAVTIYHDALLDVIHDRYPGLRKIASCIRFVGGKKSEFKVEDGDNEYDRAFADPRFSYIVPLNQHTTHRFLQRYKSQAARIIAFLNLECASSDIYQCYCHYCGTERGDGISWKYGDMLLRKDFEYIKSQTEEPMVNPCRGGFLSSRADDVQGLIKMGVRSFKIPSESMLNKTTTFESNAIKMLLELIYRQNQIS